MARRLAAILAADVVGYSTLMNEDEAGTLVALKAHRAELFDPETAKRGGRIVKLMGDGVLVEFPSVVDAVECALAIQTALAAESGKIRLRIGINLGDIIIDGDDIYGDGVNVAARLEALAEPGGIAISRMVREGLGNRVEADFSDAGEHQVKNIARPIQVWRWSPVPVDTPYADAKSLSERPSIAVLPFTNMSGDPEQEYFSDGITEDIITELSRFNSLFVIARNSSFHYKGRSPRIQDVGRELGVRYVVEGSVRKSGSRVRITAQLIETSTENHLWAERYDRELEDIFAVQDDVVREIATAVPGQVDIDEMARVHRRPADNPTAYDYLLRGERLRLREWGSLDAKQMFEKAIEADAQCARAYAHLSNWHAYSILAHGNDIAESRRLAENLAGKALLIEPNDPPMLALLSEGYLMAGELGSARRCIDKAIKLNPNSYMVMLYASIVVAWLGDVEAGLRWGERFMRHDPLSAEAAREASFEFYYLCERFDEAIESTVGWIDPPIHVLAEIAAAHAQAGRLDEAESFRKRYQNKRPPGFTFRDHIEAQAIMCGIEKHRDLWLEGYRKAGFDCS